MKFIDAKRFLKPYSIFGSRKTTINHAFAAAIAPHDQFSESLIRSAIELLGQNPDDELECAYCGKKAETWDHINATVEKGEFSGFGHRFGNLLPCCKTCNSRKGNKHWEQHLRRLLLPEHEFEIRQQRIRSFVEKYTVRDIVPRDYDEYDQYLKLRDQILVLMRDADKLAEIIRGKSLTPSVFRQGQR